MAKVIGLGGIFLKVDGKDEVSSWYSEVLGMDIQAWGGAIFAHTAQGRAVWSLFDSSTSYFDPSPHPVMINLIVDDLDGVLARAQAKGVHPLGRDDQDGQGRFAWLLDPRGFKLELWQPAERGGDAAQERTPEG